MPVAVVTSQMTSMSKEDVAKLASVFGVEPAQVRLTSHSAANADLARVRFLRGRSVATALSSFLNHEFYRPETENIDDLLYSPNPYSFVDEQSDPAELCLTVNEEPDAFVEKLRKIGPDIGFVALHPEMLFAMKKVKGDYHAARKVVESGHAD